jgi:integrase
MIQEEIIDVIRKALEERNSFQEPSCSDLLGLIPELVQAGLSGELNGKGWTQGYSKNSKYYLAKFVSEARSLGFENNPLSPEAVRRVISTNKNGVTEKRSRHSAVVALCRLLVQRGLLPKSRLEEIRALRPKRTIPPKKRFITREEIDQIIWSVESCSFTLVYDKKLFITAIETAEETGLRIGEICNIKVCDLNLETRELYVSRAKGGSNFVKGLTLRNSQILQEYLAIRPKTESLNLFVLDNGKPLSRETLIQRFRRVTKKLGLDTSFHAFRRRYISRHLQDGKSLVDVSLAVNHKSPRMTEQYLIPDVRRSIEAQKQW